MAGSHAIDTLTLARLPSGVPVRTRLHRYEGAADGPTLYVQAAQHGREVNGVEVLRRFHERVPLEDLQGTVFAVPVANPLTFDRVSYTVPEVLDSVTPNMNRVWPGDADGTLHERMAARLWSVVETADALVDLHTGSPAMLPHVVYLEGHEPSRALGAAFGTDVLLSEQSDEDAPQEWHRRSFGGKLRVAATDAGIPAITPELAHSRTVVEDVVETGVDGLLNVCRHLDMLPGDPIQHDPTLARNHLGQITAAESGLFVPEHSLELGQHVPRACKVGTVFHPTRYEPHQRATTEWDGILLALTREATVVAGDKLATVAIERQ